MLKVINEKLHTPNWLFFLILGVLVLRIPSFFEPYSYGDEMIYLALGEGIRQKIPLYSGIHDNKPPLLYLAAALAGSLFWFKAILAFWHVITIYVFWKLSEVLFPEKKGKKNQNLRLQQISTTLFAIFTTIPFLEGNIANAENFMIGFTLLGFYILLAKKLTPKNIFIAGAMFSVSALFKIPAAFDVPAIIFVWFVAIKKINLKSVKKLVINSIYLGLGFVAPMGLTFIWYYFQGALGQYVVAAYLQNVGYLSSWRPDDVQLSFLDKNAPLLIRAGIVAFGILILYIKKTKLSRNFIFLTSWLLLTLFAVTLSERPYPHYFLQSVAPASLLIGILFAKSSFEQSLTIIPLALTFFVPVYFNFWHYPTLPYYVKFVRFATKQTTKAEYFDTFGGQVSRNYEISDFLMSSTESYERVFVWGDSSAIYALSRRLPPIKYVADYHIRDFSSGEEVMSALWQNTPSFIVLMPDSPNFPSLNLFLNENYASTENIDGAQIWKLLSPKVRALIAQ